MNQIFAPRLLSGKKILVTGASSGIGKATSLILSSYGAELLITGRNAARLNATALEASKASCTPVIMNLDNFEDISNWAFNVAQKYGPFDGVFHAAGEALIKPMRLVKLKDYEHVFNPSLMAAVALSSALLKKSSMNDGGSIVFMSSVAALTGRQGMGLYSASKAGIDGLVRSLAIELASRRIRVNSLAAGAIDTEMHEQIKQTTNADTMAAYESLHPLGFGNLSDVANMVVYLLSDASRWITGTILTVDGGYSAR